MFDCGTGETKWMLYSLTEDNMVCMLEGESREVCVYVYIYVFMRAYDLRLNSSTHARLALSLSSKRMHSPSVTPSQTAHATRTC